MAELKIDVQNLHKSYGDNEVLKGIDAKFYEGDVVCIIGPSGSGKSTILNIIAGLLDATSGDVYLDGQNTKEMEIGKIGELVGSVFQDPRSQFFTTNIYFTTSKFKMQ